MPKRICDIVIFWIQDEKISLFLNVRKRTILSVKDKHDTKYHNDPIFKGSHILLASSTSSHNFFCLAADIWYICL